MTTFAMTVPIIRRSPIRIPRRDLVASSGDNLSLRMTLVTSDRPDAAPVDLSGFGPQVLLRVWAMAANWCDYGRPNGGTVLMQGAGVVTDGAAGKVTLGFGAGAITAIGPRMGWTVQMGYGGDVATLCWGVLNLFRGSSVVSDPSYVLTDDGGIVLTDDFSPVVL